MTLTENASVRLVAAEGVELIPLSHEAAAEYPVPVAHAAVKRCFEEAVGKAWPGDMDTTEDLRGAHHPC